MSYLELLILKATDQTINFRITGESGGDGYELEDVEQIQGTNALYKSTEGACQIPFVNKGNTININANKSCWSDDPCFVCGDLVKKTPAAARQ